MFIVKEMCQLGSKIDLSRTSVEPFENRNKRKRSRLEESFWNPNQFFLVTN